MARNQKITIRLSEQEMSVIRELAVHDGMTATAFAHEAVGKAVKNALRRQKAAAKRAAPAAVPGRDPSSQTVAGATLDGFVQVEGGWGVVIPHGHPAALQSIVRVRQKTNGRARLVRLQERLYSVGEGVVYKAGGVR